MLKRGLFAVVFGAVLLGAALSIQAQAAGWYAFLYNGASRQLLRINAEGAQETFDLGLDENIFLGGQDMAFTADGGRVALCANSAHSETPQGDTTLIVRDLAAQQNVMALPLGENIGCRVTRAGFNEDASQVAVGVVKYFPGSPEADPNSPAWRLLVVDVASSSIVAELNADSPQVSEAGMLADTALIPEVRHFTDNQIIFAEVPWAVGAAPEWRAFRWQPASGALELDGAGYWGKSGLSYIPQTSELAWLDMDPSLPASDPGGPLPAFNVVKMLDNGADRIIHHTGDWSLVDTEFINAGRQLGILWLSTFDPNNPDEQEGRWMALGRDGSLTELVSSATFSQIANAPDGFALFELSFNEDFTQQTARLSYVANGERRTLWESGEANWEFAGATEVQPAGDLTPFPAVQPSG